MDEPALGLDKLIGVAFAGHGARGVGSPKRGAPRGALS